MLRRHMLLVPACALATAAQRNQEKREEESGKDSAARALKQRMQHLTARAIAMQEAVRALEERLREQGLSLDPDIAATRTRMEIFMDEAEAELKAGRLQDAAQAMDRADGAIRKLEARLGAR